MKNLCLFICLMSISLSAFAGNKTDVVLTAPNLEIVKKTLKEGNCLATGKSEIHATTDEVFYSEDVFIYPCSLGLEKAKTQKFVCRNIAQSPNIQCGTVVINDKPTTTDSGFQIWGFARTGKPSKNNPSECEQSMIQEDGQSDVHYELSFDLARICEL